MKIKLPVDKKKLQDVINDIELKYTDLKTGELTITNRSQLADIISNTEWAKNHQPKPISASVVKDRMNKFGLTCKTPIGKKGRQKGEAIVRTNKPKKTSTEANNALTKYMGPRYKSLSDKIIKGSRQAATKAMCIQCVGLENVSTEIRNCTVFSCPLFNFRPYK